MAEAYPLHWPEGWPRTSSSDRKYGRFGKQKTSGHGWKRTEDITIAEALDRIYKEIEMLDGPGGHWARIDPDQTIISTNLKVRRGDGRPSSSQKEPGDPGAAVYFEMDGKRQCVPCDSYTKVAQNLAGIAATISALRTLERHGSGLMEKAFTGFEQLPPAMQAEPPWYVVLDVDEGYRDVPEVVEKCYRYARSLSHPDRPGGSSEKFNQVQKAWEQYKAEHSGLREVGIE